MQFDKIISNLNKKNFAPIYFLMGDESYFIDQISNKISNDILDESEKEFNQTIIYGKETSVENVISICRRYPINSKYNIVIIKEAQNLKNIEKIEAYIDNYSPSTILVVCYKNKTLDKRKKFTKKLSEKFILFESKKLYENQIIEWINNYLSLKGFKIEHKACFLLAEFLGVDLNKLCNEIEKLMLISYENKNISLKLIEENIGISKDFNNFELTNAISKKNILKCNQIVNYFASNQSKHPFVVTISVLFNFFNKILTYHSLKDKSDKNIAQKLKINYFFIKNYKQASYIYTPEKTIDIISLLRKYDLKSKGVNNSTINNGELLKELIYRILH